MGIFLETKRTTIGLGKVEQYEHRTQPQGHPSGPGDLDLTVYSARKWCRLALNGNPSILLPLFAPQSAIVVSTEEGHRLWRLRSKIVSRHAGPRFLGYLNGQRERLLGRRARHGRTRKMPDGSHDPKYAMHMLRLGYQGIELMRTGSIRLPMDDERGDYLRVVRRGEVGLDEVLTQAERLEQELTRAIDTSHLPEVPDEKAIETWLIDAHERSWRVA
jgi:hypothetical protein